MESNSVSATERSTACSAPTARAKPRPSAFAPRAPFPLQFVHIAGIDVVAFPALARCYMGVVPQFNTLDRACTVYENIHFHCLYFGFSRAEAKLRTSQLLEQFTLTERAGSYPAQLSGGLAQRVQIARAIAHRPKVLFLDEPSAGLDPQSRIAMWEAVAGLRKEGITVVLTTHYMEEADELCDRVAIIDHGRILVEDTPTALKSSVGAQKVYALDLSHPSYTAPLISQLQQMQGVRGVESTTGGIRILADNADGLLPEIVRVSNPYGLRDLTMTETSLETVFNPALQAVTSGSRLHANLGIRDRSGSSGRCSATQHVLQRWVILARLPPGLCSTRSPRPAPREVSLSHSRHHEPAAVPLRILLHHAPHERRRRTEPHRRHGRRQLLHRPAPRAHGRCHHVPPGIAAVARPLAQEFGITREIDDRVMCPLPVAAVAIEKIVFSALQSMVAAAIVFPLAYYVPATPVVAHVNSWLFLVLVLGPSLGLARLARSAWSSEPPSSLPRSASSSAPSSCPSRSLAVCTTPGRGWRKCPSCNTPFSSTPSST